MTDRVTLVTEGASGIGKGIATLVGASCDRVAVVDIDDTAARPAADEITAAAVRRSRACRRHRRLFGCMPR